MQDAEQQAPIPAPKFEKDNECVSSLSSTQHYAASAANMSHRMA